MGTVGTVATVGTVGTVHYGTLQSSDSYIAAHLDRCSVVCKQTSGQNNKEKPAHSAAFTRKYDLQVIGPLSVVSLSRLPFYEWEHK